MKKVQRQPTKSYQMQQYFTFGNGLRNLPHLNPRDDLQISPYLTKNEGNATTWLTMADGPP